MAHDYVLQGTEYMYVFMCLGQVGVGDFGHENSALWNLSPPIVSPSHPVSTPTHPDCTLHPATPRFDAV
jgi:hypothetical protein